VQGELGPEAYDMEWFSAYISELLQQPFVELMAPNLPTFALLAVPVAWLDPHTARNVWTFANLGLSFAFLGLVFATVARPRLVARLPFYLAFAALFFVSPSLFANFAEGQAYLVMLCLLSLAFLGLQSRRDGLLGIALGAAFILKASGLPLWLFLVATRRWKALGWGVLTSLSVALISLRWIGLDTWLAHPQASARATIAPSVTATVYQTVYTLFSHLFRFDAQWNPRPIADVPPAIGLLYVLVAIVGLSVTLWAARGASNHRFFAALVPLCVVLLPLAQEYHFVLLFLPLFILLDDLLQQEMRSTSGWALLGLACVLLVYPFRYFPHIEPAWSGGWLALLAYPRLYGAWVLWGLALHCMVARNGSRVRAETVRPNKGGQNYSSRAP
jgi:hypothetical protein